LRRRYLAAGHEWRLELGVRCQRYASSDPCRESLDAVHEVGAEILHLAGDLDKLPTFYDFPAEHWKHLRSTNIIESPFATVRLRQRVTVGLGSRTKAITMAFKLSESAGL
jgi:hypothetical protein